MYLLIFVIIAVLTGFTIRNIKAGLSIRKKNKGFFIVSDLVVACDVLAILYVCIKSPGASRSLTLCIYLVSSWILTALIYMIGLMNPNNKDSKYVIISAVMAAYRSFIVAAQLFGARFFSFENKELLNRIWPVAGNSQSTFFLFDYTVFELVHFANIALAVWMLVLAIRSCPEMFRARYIAFLVTVVSYASIELLVLAAELPQWIPCMVYNAIPFVGLVFCGDYNVRKIREWSLDNFADNMNDGLILYDGYGELIHMNAMIRRSLHAELISAFEDKAKLEEWAASVKNVENTQVVEYEGPGRVYYFQIHVQELSDNGYHIGTLYMLHDRSDTINRIKSMHKANEELEKASRMKSDFLANMSHEIRTPMNAVIGMAEIAMRENDPARVADYLLQIQSSGKNLLNIINDILDYSKIESGKMEIIEDEYCPFDELSDIANVLNVRIGTKPVKLYVLVKTALPHKLVGDAMRIRQIIINLANNAIKFTNSGTVHIIVNSEVLNDRYVNLTYHVIDTGIGIKKEDLDKLFNSFNQVDAKRNRSVEGTGLGLAISKRLVSAMNGEMGVESEYGKGSDFWFTIPQKISDENDDMIVKDAEGKYAYGISDNEIMVREFENEMDRLGVKGRIISSLDDYVPTGLKDFVFVQEKDYNDKLRDFLESHRDVNCIILIEFDSGFTTDIPNIHPMRKPETTMNMVNILNERFDESNRNEEGKLFKVDFAAPDAKVLVVDDNKINLTIAEGLMSSMKIHPEFANGGQEAIEKTLAGEYDIVFMDHMMPEVDGVEATIKIRKTLNSMIHPVIIALSANVVEEAKRLFKNAGMNDFVAKPVDIKDLATKIKKWLPEDKIIPVDPDAAEDAAADAQVEVPAAQKVKYSGFDTETALRSLGSIALYDKILEEYYRSGRDKFEGIRQAYASEDWADYTIRVHALKSSSRQIGALGLGDMAEELEKAGKASDIDTIRKKTDGTLEVYNTLLNALEEYYASESGDEDDADKELIDPDTLHGLIDELATACDDLDMDAMESVSDRLKTYSFDDDIRPLIDDLQKAISEMDTEKCMEIVEQIR